MASEVIQTLVTELTADGAKQRAELAKSNKDMEAWGKKVVSVAKKAAIGLSAGLAVKSFAGLVKGSIDSADALSKMSQIVGVGIEDLSKLKYAAELSDVSLDQLGTGLKKFSKNIVAAADGTGSQADAFAELGVSLKNSDGSLKSTNQLVGDVAEAFSHFEDGATKTAIATELFGKAGADLIPMLNGGRRTIKEAGDELERMGGVIDKNTGLAAERFNDNINKLEVSLKSMGSIIAKEVIDPLADLSDSLADPEAQKGLAALAAMFANLAIVSGKSLVGLGRLANFFLGDLSDATDAAAEDVSLLEKQLKSAMDKTYEIQFAVDFDANDPITQQRLEEAYKEAQRVADRLAVAKQKAAPKPTEDKWSADAMADADALNVEANRAANEARKASLKSLQEEQKRLNELVLKEGDSYREKLALSADATEQQKLLYRTQQGDLKGISEQKMVSLSLDAQELDMREQIKIMDEFANKKLEEKKELYKSLMTPIELINDQYDEQIKKIKETATSEEEANELIIKSNALRTKALDDNLKSTKTDMSEFSKQAARNMQSAFADFLFDPFEDDLDGLVKNFGKAIQRMLAEWAAAQVFEGIGAWGKSNKADAGVVGGIASIISGFYADGGRPAVGKVSVVGDGGEPELFVPDTAGTIIPFSKLGGGGSTVHIGSMNFPGVTNAREAEMAAGAAGRKLLGVMNNAQRYA